MTNQTTTPPLTDEALENKLISLAYDQAQAQLEAHKAPSQVVTFFLKLGTIRAQVELEKLELESKLIEEKIQSEKSGAHMKEMMGDVMAALTRYTARPPGDYDDDL